jgi:hypothetical protein
MTDVIRQVFAYRFQLNPLLSLPPSLLFLLLLHHQFSLVVSLTEIPVAPVVLAAQVIQAAPVVLVDQAAQVIQAAQEIQVAQEILAILAILVI